MNLEWQRIGAWMHIASDFFVRTSPKEPGVDIIHFFLNKTGNPCPGLPKIYLNVDQWGRLVEGIMQVHGFLFKEEPIAPCFLRENHFDPETKEFDCCEICICFVGKNSKKKDDDTE